MTKHLINEPFIEEILSQRKISILDGGARGEVFPPFNRVKTDVLKIIRFEPDPNATIIENENEIIVPKGLWRETSRVNLNVAISPSASSVLEFNTLLQSHIDPLKNLRRVAKTIPIECTSIDEFMSESTLPSLDFIKLDIHGAEYEVIEGAKNTLKQTLGLLIESWTIPIHKNQKTRGAVEDKVYEHGFYLFEEFAHSMWSRKSPTHTKKQPVSIDSLYFKDSILDNITYSLENALKMISIADLFNHTGFAIQLNEYFASKNIIKPLLFNKIDSLLQNTFKESIITKLKHKILTKVESRLNSCSFK